MKGTTVSAPHIVAKDLSKSFGAVKALQDLTFEVRPGEIFGILGPNGAGKTTALYLVLGMIEPTGGEARVLGHSPWHRRDIVCPRINFCSAYVHLPFNLTVEHNLLIYAGLYGVPDAEREVADLLELFQLTPLARSMTGALSSGEQTRLNLCKSFLNDPEILVLDEPTASLDPEMAEMAQCVLKRAQSERGVTILYTSHNMAEVEALCGRALFLHHGRKVVEGTPQEIRDHFGEDSLERVFWRLSRANRAPA